MSSSDLFIVESDFERSCFYGKERFYGCDGRDKRERKKFQETPMQIRERERDIYT